MNLEKLTNNLEWREYKTKTNDTINFWEFDTYEFKAYIKNTVFE